MFSCIKILLTFYRTSNFEPQYEHNFREGNMQCAFCAGNKVHASSCFIARAYYYILCAFAV